MAATALTYEEWMEEVNKEVEAIAGVSVHDLPDFPSRDWYEAEVDPVEAAEDVLADAGWEG